MKKVILILCLCTLLCGCGMSEGTIVGVWGGSGSVSVLGVGVGSEISPAETWTFREDGAAQLEVSLGEGALPIMEFTYTYEDGVLTLQANGRSVSVPCQQVGDTLVLNPETEDPAIFTRAG